MKRAAICVVGLRKSFGDKVVLDGIDLSITEGTIFALLGPNGAGKTTAVRILSTLLSADGGELRVAGHDVKADADAVRDAIGMTGQFPGTTVAGQFITNEQYGILFEKGSALRTCVNAALQELKDDGTAKSLQEKYFPGSTELPVIK